MSGNNWGHRKDSLRCDPNSLNVACWEVRFMEVTTSMKQLTKWKSLCTAGRPLSAATQIGLGGSEHGGAGPQRPRFPRFILQTCLELLINASHKQLFVPKLPLYDWKNTAKWELIQCTQSHLSSAGHGKGFRGTGLRPLRADSGSWVPGAAEEGEQSPAADHVPGWSRVYSSSPLKACQGHNSGGWRPGIRGQLGWFLLETGRAGRRSPPSSHRPLQWSWGPPGSCCLVTPMSASVITCCSWCDRVQMSLLF